MEAGFFQRLALRGCGTVSIFHDASDCFQSMVLPQRQEWRRPELSNQNGRSSFGIKGKHSNGGAVIFDLSLDKLSVGQANPCNREAGPSLVIGFDIQNFAFHARPRERLFVQEWRKPNLLVAALV
jgi:hypothetical protein